MRGGNSFNKAVLILLLIGGWLFSLSQSALSQGAFSFIPVEKGGVGEDIQLLRKANGSASNIVWAVNMESGCFRSEYSSGNWGPWHMYRPGFVMNGIEAVQDYEGDTPHEYVMFTLQGFGDGGIYYMKDPPLTPGNWGGDWPRPNGEDYPDDQGEWGRGTWVLDAAFYYDATEQNYYVDATHNPETQYFAILGTHLASATPRGIYRWRDDPNYDFVRVDSSGGGTPAHDHGFNHFWRDLQYQNMIYSIQNPIVDDEGNRLESGRLWKFSGAYTQTNGFNPVANFPNPTQLRGVIDFNQWKDGETVYSYILVRTTSDEYKVYVSDDLASASPSFDVYPLDPELMSIDNRDWTLFGEWPDRSRSGFSY